MKRASLSGQYRINAPDVVAEEFDGRFVILNLANGHYFSLEGLAGRMWELVLAGHRLDAVSASVGRSRPELAESADAFLQRLIDLNLVRPDEGSRTDAEDIVELWAGDEPRLIVYDDLAELIYADPVHDVDEQAGWPALRNAE